MNIGTLEQDIEFKNALAELKTVKGAVMPALQKAQEIYKFLPREAINLIASELNVSTSEIYGVATFYSQFSLSPVGKYKIAVCLGTACYVKGSGEILNKVKEVLKIDDGETTADGLFSIDASRCVGCCGLAPVMTINDEVYGRVKPEEVASILAKYKI